MQLISLFILFYHSWSEPVQAPADLEIPDEQWQAAEEKLQSLVSERQPRAQSALSQASPPIEPLYEPENDRPISKYHYEISN